MSVLALSHLRSLRTQTLSCYAFLPSAFHTSTATAFHTSSKAEFHTSTAMSKRMGKRVSAIPEWKRKKLAEGPWWKPKEPLVMKAPISKTHHPENRFAEIEQKLQEQVAVASACDAPISDMADPYEKEPAMCTLCPRRYEEKIVPNYKNPKLLSQFVSPHTGRVYQKHITGLCTYMQGLVRREVKKSRMTGFMSTHVKSVNYLQDPPLFNAARPIKKNPF